MDLKKLIKEVLYGDCCKAIKPTKAPILNENLASREILSEGLKYHIDNKKPLTEHVYRAGSSNYFNLWSEARSLYVRGILDFSGDDLEILTETHLGEFGIIYEIEIGDKVKASKEYGGLSGEVVDVRGSFVVVKTKEGNQSYHESDLKVLNKEGKKVPLDFIMEEEEVFPFEYKGFKYIDDQLMFEGTLTEDNIAELQKIKKEIEALMPRLSWIDDVTFSDFNGDLDIELDYELNPQEIKQLSQVASKYDMRLIYKTGKNATLTKRRIPSKIDELNEAKKKSQKKDPPIGKPMRDSSGGKAYKVYVRDPKTKKIKTVRFGSGGLKAKINNSKARQAFAKRHKCSTRNDKTKASYWSCRLPRYAKLLGLKSSFSGFW